MTNSLSVPGAVRAALGVAHEHGLTVHEPEVLKNGANVIVHLAPAPVVARVAATTAAVRADPAAFLARDIALASFAAERGAEVVPPSDEVPPDVHRRDGWVMTFWRFVEHERGAEGEPGELGAALARLHVVLADYDDRVALPYLGPVLGEVTPIIERLRALDVLSTSDAARLRDRSDTCAAALPRERAVASQALHGDAHRRNVLCTSGGLVWTDFEDCCTGSIAWDLACTHRSGPGVLAAYGERPSDAEIAPYLAARALLSELWELIFQARDTGRLGHHEPPT